MKEGDPGHTRAGCQRRLSHQARCTTDDSQDTARTTERRHRPAARPHRIVRRVRCRESQVDPGTGRIGHVPARRQEQSRTFPNRFVWPKALSENVLSRALCTVSPGPSRARVPRPAPRFRPGQAAVPVHAAWSRRVSFVHRSRPPYRLQPAGGSTAISAGRERHSLPGTTMRTVRASCDRSAGERLQPRSRRVRHCRHGPNARRIRFSTQWTE